MVFTDLSQNFTNPYEVSDYSNGEKAIHINKDLRPYELLKVISKAIELSKK